MDYCLATGCPHPDLIFERLTFEQWLDWVAFHEVAPWGDRRADARLAVSFWAALAPHVEDAGPGFVPLFPYIPDEKPELSEAEVIAYTSAMAAYMEAMSDGRQNNQQPGDPAEPQ